MSILNEYGSKNDDRRNKRNNNVIGAISTGLVTAAQRNEPDKLLGKHSTKIGTVLTAAQLANAYRYNRNIKKNKISGELAPAGSIHKIARNNTIKHGALATGAGLVTAHSLKHKHYKAAAAAGLVTGYNAVKAKLAHSRSKTVGAKIRPASSKDVNPDTLYNSALLHSGVNNFGTRKR